MKPMNLLFLIIFFGELLISIGILTNPILQYLTEGLNQQIITLHPFELFMAQLLVWCSLSLAVCIPILLSLGYDEIKDALKLTEKRIIIYAILPAVVLSCGGFILSFIFIMPYIMGLFAVTPLNTTISLMAYINITLMLSLAVGVLLTIPVIISTGIRTRILNIKLLQDKRKYVYVFALVVGALLTPPDIFTMLLVAVPFIILYEGSIVVSKLSLHGGSNVQVV